MRTRSTLGYHQDVIEGMMSASEPFGEVETFINESAVLDQDEKAASPGVRTMARAVAPAPSSAFSFVIGFVHDTPL
jgi:hypothetical protein